MYLYTLYGIEFYLVIRQNSISVFINTVPGKRESVKKGWRGRSAVWSMRPRRGGAWPFWIFRGVEKP